MKKQLKYKFVPTMFILSLLVISCNRIEDIDGNIYKTITIGDQTWMAENLRVTRYNDGAALINVEDRNEEWNNLRTGGVAWYNNSKDKYGDKYGALYNWYAVNGKADNGVTICPKGWHIPEEIEWRILLDYLGGPSIAGKALAKVGTEFWTNQVEVGNNTVGFDAVGSGLRWTDGQYNKLNEFAYFWTQTRDTASDKAFYFRIGGNANDVFQNTNYKTVGFSVRCVKD